MKKIAYYQTMKKIMTFIILIIVSTSCATKWFMVGNKSEKIYRGVRVKGCENIITGDNIKLYNAKGEYFGYLTSTSNIIYYSMNDQVLGPGKLKKKNLTLITQHPYYVSETIKVKRSLRFGPLIGDLALTVLSGGWLAPVIGLDFYNNNIWKINKNSKYIYLKFNFNDAFYKSRYELAQSYGLADSISNYILIYGNSPYIKDALDYRDLLNKRDVEYGVLKSSENYWGAEKFISNYPNSIYQDELNKITPQYYFKYKSNKSLPWDSIGNYMQVIYSNFLNTAEEFEKQNKHSEAVKNYEYALKIFFDSEINFKKDEANNLYRIDLVKNGDDFIENQDYTSAINVYKKAQSIYYSQEVQSKLNNVDNIRREILAELERQRKIEIENSAIKCAVCKVKIYKNYKGYYSVYYWNNFAGCIDRITESPGRTFLPMGPYCSSGCCSSKRAKSGRSGVHKY